MILLGDARRMRVVEYDEEADDNHIVDANAEAEEENRAAEACGGEEGEHDFDDELPALICALVAAWGEGYMKK